MGSTARSPQFVFCLMCALVLVANSAWAQDLSTRPARNRTASKKEDKKYTIEKSVVYHQYDDGLKLRCDVYQPTGKGPFPVMVMIHGGAWRTGTPKTMNVLAKKLAEKEYVAIAISYRLAPKYKWPSQIVDCRHALKWIVKNKAKYKIDADQIGIWGYSAGGHLATYLGTTSDTDQEIKDIPIKCVVCGGGPVDFSFIPKDLPVLNYFLGVTRGADPERYKQAAPITHLTKNDPPIFFYHGKNDITVPIQGVKNMMKKSEQIGANCQLYEIKYKEHLLAFIDRSAINEAFGFLDKCFDKE